MCVLSRTVAMCWCTGDLKGCLGGVVVRCWKTRSHHTIYSERIGLFSSTSFSSLLSLSPASESHKTQRRRPLSPSCWLSSWVVYEKCTALPTCDNAVTFVPLIGIVNKEKLGRRKVTGLAVKRKRSAYVRSIRKSQITEEVGEKTTGEEKMPDGKFLSWLLEKLTVGTKSSIRHYILMKERLQRLHKRALMWLTCELAFWGHVNKNHELTSQAS